jgi:hypothetical protein
VASPAVSTAPIVSGLNITPTKPTIGEKVTINAILDNISEFNTTYKIALKINGLVIESRDITVPAKTRQTLNFFAIEDIPGKYAVDLSGLTGTFEVSPSFTAAIFSLYALSISPAKAAPGQQITISTQLTNTGDLSGTCEVILKINDVTVETKNITLQGKTNQVVTFINDQAKPGKYTVRVNNLTGVINVNLYLLGPLFIGGIAFAAIIFLLTIWVVLRRAYRLSRQIL